MLWVIAVVVGVIGARENYRTHRFTRASGKASILNGIQPFATIAVGYFLLFRMPARWIPALMAVVIVAFIWFVATNGLFRDSEGRTTFRSVASGATGLFAVYVGAALMVYGLWLYLTGRLRR